MVFDFTTIIGIIGAAMILLAFILAQLKMWEDEWLRYDLVNLIGSAFLVWYGILIKGYPFVALNAIWFLVSLRDVFIDLKKKRPHRIAT